MIESKYIKNAHLPGDDFLWQGNKTGVLLIHGFTATTAEVRPMAHILHEAGMTTAGPLLPGHGTHPDDMNRATWQMWVEKVKKAYQELLPICDHVFVLGESMGALLAIELAAQHPEITGVILFAPAIKVIKLWQARLLLPFKAYIEKSSKEDGLPWKGYTVNPVKAAVQLLKLQKHTRKQLSKIHQPTLIFTGEYDRTIAAESATVILNGIQSEKKHHVHMEDSAHCIMLDKEKDQAAEHVLSFIQTGM